MRVTFCGHKEVENRDSVKQWLYGVCLNLIKQGTNEFYLGGYGEFDFLCAATLREVQNEYPHIRLILVLPYLNCKTLYAGYDETVYPPLESVPKRFAISRRNEWMVQECDVVVAYVRHGWGGLRRRWIMPEERKSKSSCIRI